MLASQPNYFTPLPLSVCLMTGHLGTDPHREWEGEEDEGRGQQRQHRSDNLHHAAAARLSACRGQSTEAGETVSPEGVGGQ